MCAIRLLLYHDIIMLSYAVFCRNIQTDISAICHRLSVLILYPQSFIYTILFPSINYLLAVARRHVGFPHYSREFHDYQGQSPQEIRYQLGEKIRMIIPSLFTIEPEVTADVGGTHYVLVS